MKEFNLEKALAGEPVVDMDGQKVTGLHLFKEATVAYPVFGVRDSGTRVVSYSKLGEAGDVIYPNLVMAPTLKHGHVTIFSDGTTGGRVHNSLSEAINTATSHPVAIVAVSWES